MRNSILYGFAILCTSLAHSQSNKTFIIEYRFSQKMKTPDSILNKNINSNVAVPGSEDTVDLHLSMRDFLPDNFEIKGSHFMLANTDSSKGYYVIGQENYGGASIMINTPDTFYFKNQQWSKLTDGIKEIIPNDSFSFQETNETKQIIGYTCTRFTAIDSADHDTITIWACKQLPNTLVPFPGLVHFPYAILEITDRETFLTVANRIISF